MLVLSIAGSDPSAGAGIQNDIKTFSALGVYGVTVVTAITSQNTKKFLTVEEISSKMIASQLESVLNDFKINAIKIGMVYSSEIIKIIYHKLKKIKIPIVLDPVFESTTGGILLQKQAFSEFKKLLVPLAFVITPNIPEAEKLAGMRIRTKSDVKLAAKKIRKLGASRVIIKGGHFGSKKVTDFVLDGMNFYEISSNKISITNHGGGCTFSASLSVFLAKGQNIKDATKSAKEFTLQSIKNAQKIGRGLRVATQVDKTKQELSTAISKFIDSNPFQFIPECQTNFVFAKPDSSSLADIVGVSGRIVKASKSVILAGSLEYGGSRHVASAILEIRKRFPALRSALNIKYDEKLIEKAMSRKLYVLNYDRSVEPRETKSNEGNSISWGIQEAIKNAKKSPDVVYHKGDYGKEPMILIFGKKPQDVLDKLARIVR